MDRLEVTGGLESCLPYDSPVNSRRVWLGCHINPVDSHQPACFGSSALRFPGQVILGKLLKCYEPQIPHSYNRANISTYFCLRYIRKILIKYLAQWLAHSQCSINVNYYQNVLKNIQHFKQPNEKPLPSTYPPTEREFPKIEQWLREWRDFVLQALEPLETPWPWFLRESRLPWESDESLGKAALTPPSRGTCADSNLALFSKRKSKANRVSLPLA